MVRAWSSRSLRRIGAACSFACLPWLWGCATALHGSRQAVVVNTRPPGARVIVDNTMESRSPCTFNLARKTDHHVVIDLDGYAREEFNVTRVPTGKTVNNIWIGGLVGWAVDSSTGADNKLVPESIDVTLRPVAPAPTGEAVTMRGAE